MLIVQKYGGSSVADVVKVKNVASRVIEAKKRDYDLVVVVSAPGNMTDDLTDLAKKISPSPPAREMDMLLATGEQHSIALLAMAIHEQGHKVISLTGPQAGIRTNERHGKARIINIDTDKIIGELRAGKIVVVAGFQGSTVDNAITTLSRGGSDTTAVALAAALNADLCEIYTDVDGVFTADPNIVPKARKLDKISYDEMLEMASLGAKVLHRRAVEYAKKYDVLVHVRSSLNQSVGTIVAGEVENMEGVKVSGVTHDKNQAKISLFGVADRPGVAHSIFQAIGAAEMNVDMIVQNVGKDGKTNISFTVPMNDLENALQIVQDVGKKVGAMDITADKDIAKVSVVGIGMKSHAGVAAEMFGVLADENINIQMISTSEIKISCVIAEKDTEKAVLAIHKKFLE